MPQATLGVIVGNRDFFPDPLVVEARRDIERLFAELGIEAVMLDESQSKLGSVETWAHAQRCAELFRANRDRIAGVLVSLPNFGDEKGVADTLKLAELNVPVLVQGYPDDLGQLGVDRRRDAFCGKISVCNNLRQYGVPFTLTELHTVAIQSEEFRRDLRDFLSVCRVVRGLRRARIGAVGARPNAFNTTRYSEKLLQAAGITVVPVDLSEVLAHAERLRENRKDVQDKIVAIRGYGTIPDRIPAASVLKQAKLSVAIDLWMAANECTASAIQCWESVQANYGCATCLSMSLMGEQKRMPSACEVDVSGAVSMLAITLASGNAAALLDWNNNYGTDRGKCVATHCSNFPRSFVGGEVEISELDILGESLGRDKCFGAIKGTVKPGPMTCFRMDTDDRRGLIRGYVGEGAFTNDPFPMDGGIAVCEIRELRALLALVTRGGFAHHVAMVRSHCAAIVHEATTRYMGWDIRYHGATPGA